MSLEAFSQILFWIFILTNVIFCALFFGKIYVSYQAADRKTAVVIKAIVSFLIWLAAAFVVIAVSAGYFAGHTPEARTVQLESATVYLIGFILGWILVGMVILFWMSRPQRKNYGSN